MEAIVEFDAPKTCCDYAECAGENFEFDYKSFYCDGGADE